MSRCQLQLSQLQLSRLQSSQRSRRLRQSLTQRCLGRSRRRTTVSDRTVLIRPVISEKSYGLMDQGAYVFVVDPRASKVEIRLAVEEAFDVRVESVNTLNRKGKRKRNRRASTFGKR